MYRGVVLAVVAGGCRWHFAELPPDATPDAVPDAPPLALACNTPVKLADAPLGAKLSAAALSSSAAAAWLAPNGQLVLGRVTFFAADQVIGEAVANPQQVGFSQVTVAGVGNFYAGAYTQNGQTFAQLGDADLHGMGSAAALPQLLGGARAIVATGSSTGPIAAVTTITMSTNQTVIYGIAADGSLSAPVALSSANPIAQSSLTNVGDRIALVNQSSVNNCFVRTLDVTIQSASATTGWGTANQCTQPQLGYSPARPDALLIRHDLTDGDLNHVIATRNGVTYTIPGESRLRNPGNEPRPIGVTDGYWVSYETGGTLEAAHVDFAGTVGTVAMLGPLAEPTAHGTVVVAGEPYAIWVQDGLELAHLCP